jgi:hypothetical protein
MTTRDAILAASAAGCAGLATIHLTRAVRPLSTIIINQLASYTQRVENTIWKRT